MKLGHVHIKVRNLQRSVDFYTGLFGLELTEQVADRFAFLTGSDMHHTLALQALNEEAPSPDPASVGLFHIAFEVPGKKAFAESYRKLQDEGIEAFTIDHIISWAMYFDDPDGNGLEIYVDTRRHEGGSKSWKGNNRPLTGKQILQHL